MRRACFASVAAGWSASRARIKSESRRVLSVGYPTQKPTRRSSARLRRHVENEVPEAITHLGTAYHLGQYGLVKSDKKAAKIWKRGVELGDVEAMECLGEAYEYGEGVKLDKKNAERLFRAAADRGDAVAQNRVASLLQSEERFEEAVRYWALAADQGYTSGEQGLGLCYRDGAGTEVDLGKARYWFERAAAKGDEDAIYELEHMDLEEEEEARFHESERSRVDEDEGDEDDESEWSTIDDDELDDLDDVPLGGAASP